MSAAIALQPLLDARTVWRAGRQAQAPLDALSTGHAGLDALLPCGGWPRAALSELLIPWDGVGELSLLLPAIAALAARGGRVVLVAPPYVPYAPAWRQAGVDLAALTVVDAGKDAPWAMEQCLRSGSCDMVLGWTRGDAQSLRRLQVAAQSGQCIGIAVRDARHAANPSPAVLRLHCVGGQWHVRKCRGAAAPVQGFALAH